MPAIPLKVTRPPASDAADPVPDAAKPLFRGTGDTDYVCGNCGAVIALGPITIDDPFRQIMQVRQHVRDLHRPFRHR